MQSLEKYHLHIDDISLQLKIDYDEIAEVLSKLEVEDPVNFAGGKYSVVP